VQINQIPKARALLFVAAACLLGSACGSSSNGPSTPTNTGQSCGVPADCYSGLDSGSVRGEVECLTRVPNGYCTHLCTADTDCCAVPGECPEALNEVCAPFESTGLLECFLTCEDSAVTASGFTDSTAFCQRYANAAFICRSTGGGSKNRKVCVPDG
jgi:hypothetical protein